MTKKIFYAIALLIALNFAATAQTKTPTVPSRPNELPPGPPPGDIQLLEGYRHIRHRGIDSQVGVISAPDGLTIRYDIGAMAGLAAPQLCVKTSACLWYKKQNVNGIEMLIGLTKDGKIYATFPKDYANFYAETKSSEQIADFLLLILTYQSKEPTIK